ncbi:MAG: hypothetical protein GXW99_05435 [Clostridiales bacterium]|nr:hypothetical protein [Clostridiales bacterium]
MYSVSDAFHAACKAPGRQFTVKAQFNGDTVLTASNILSATVNEVFDSSDGISIGSTCSSHAKIKLMQPETRVALGGGYVIPYSGLMVAGAYQYVPLGKFYVADISGKDDNSIVEITAYDGISKLEHDYTPSVNFPATIAAVAADICKQCGLTLDSAVTFPSHTISTLAEGNCKAQIGWIAGLMGKNACCDRYGKLTFRWYTATTITAGRSDQYSGGLDRTMDGNVTIHSLTTGTKDAPITAGSGTGITSMNPYMTQDIANTVYNQIKDTVIAPCKLKWRGDPSVEIGDIISATDKVGAQLSVAIMEQEMHIGGGFSMTASCYGKSDAAVVMDQRPSDAKLEKMYSGLTAAMQEATSLIAGRLGGYYHLTFDTDGFPTGWVVQDTPTITPSTRMWIMSMGGLGFSGDGGTTITKVALTMDGAVNADCITAGQMSAGRITVNGNTLSDFFDVSIDDDGHPVVRIGSSASAIVLKEYNDKIAFCDPDGTILAYWTNNAFEIINLKKFRIGSLAMVVQPNGSVSFVGA